MHFSARLGLNFPRSIIRTRRASDPARSSSIQAANRTPPLQLSAKYPVMVTLSPFVLVIIRLTNETFDKCLIAASPSFIPTHRKVSLPAGPFSRLIPVWLFFNGMILNVSSNISNRYLNKDPVSAGQLVCSLSL